LKKRTKKLLSVCAALGSGISVQMDKSLFASFSSEKEDSAFSSGLPHSEDSLNG
jgi:hypothetical protein